MTLFVRSLVGSSYNSTLLSFPPSFVMLLLAFLSCFLVFFLLRYGPNSFFSIKANCCVFEVITIEFNYWITYVQSTACS